MGEQCQSYKQGDLVCKSGFVQKSICRGFAGCSMCGHVSDKNMPHCITGEIPDHLMPIWQAAQPAPATITE